MKQAFQTILLLVVATIGFAQTPQQRINAIIGDESFIAQFNALPAENTDERLRIQTHLSYVEYLLRNASVSHLTEQQRQNRQQVLELLNEYWTAGIFPSNYDYPGERRPCFIDRNGNICAVGYLIEMTAGRTVAESINERHQYDYIMDMNEEAAVAWASEHGLTVEECAMIQPAYGNPGNSTDQPIKSSYGISSGVLGGFNTAVMINNFANRNPSRGRTVSYVGLASGAAQIILGISNIRKDEVNEFGGFYPNGKSYKTQNNLSYLNIAAGSATVITSALNLYINKNVKDKRNAFNLYSYPGMNQQLNLGLSFVRSL
ncbi:MAG TPA: hypothetical protein VD993_02060 [Chitinophagaceae bacterium]|nr:hypothetical protein [Chitinophagaceae bacterium]